MGRGVFLTRLTTALALWMAMPLLAGEAPKPDERLDLDSILKDKDEVMKTEIAEAGEGDHKQFSYRTDENIATLEVGDLYKNDEKTFFKVTQIVAKSADGGSFLVERTSGKSDPGSKLMRISGLGPLTIAVRHTLLDIYIMGGPFLHPIAILGFITLILALNSLLVYRMKRQAPPQFVEASFQALQAGDIARFEDLAMKERGLFAHVARAIADRWESSTLNDIKSRCEIAAGNQLNRLKIPIKALNLISAAAPLLGLLGTIIGMVLVFEAVASAGGANKAQALSSGIRVKLFSTAFALCVAIPSLFLYFIFNQKLSVIVAECEVLTEKLLHQVAILKRKEISKSGDLEEYDDDDDEPEEIEVSKPLARKKVTVQGSSE